MVEKISHIDYALVAKTHTPMYLMHKYWARKPHNVIAEYIKHYSKPGDIVLDPFAGSGVTAVEAIKLGRKAVAIDLDPMATFITRMTAVPVDLEKFKNAFKEIEKAVKIKINELYKTRCKRCGKETIAEALIWKNNLPKELRYNCPCSNDTSWKKPDENDIKKINDIQKKDIPYWYPNNELIWNSRVNVYQGEKVSDLFTKRNLFALSMIYNEIEKVKDEKIRDLLKFTFTSALGQASKMVFVIRKRGRQKGKVEETKEVGSWATRGYWVPPEFFEINAWNCFVERYDKIIRGKEESNSTIKFFKEAKNFDGLGKDANIFVKMYNALELEKLIPPNSVDYVFTDPPYWDAVPYLELDYMWSSWLKFKPSFDDEIIISDSPVREKREELYERMLKVAFVQIYRTLKPGRYMTVTFHNTDIRAWNAILSSCILAGFDLEKIIYQSPARPSAKGLLAPYGSAVGDYYIRFRKPEKEKQNNLEGFDEERYKNVVLQEAKRIIYERSEPTPYTYILNGIIVELKREGVLLGARLNPDDVMKEFLNKEFVLVDMKDEKGKVIGQGWWLKNPYEIPYYEFVSLRDRVETAVIDVLRRKVKVSFDDILQEIFIKFPNAMTPETQDIKRILEDYVIKTKDGNWMLKPEVKAREAEHPKMIYYLALLGKKLGFKVWIGKKEQGDVYNNKRLSELVTWKGQSFRFVPTLQQNRVKQIDVLWLDEDNVIRYEFEVENTTAITEAITRGSNIGKVLHRVIILPEEREKLLYRKMIDPMLNENITKFEWKFIFYKDLENFFIKGSKKDTDIKEFDSLFKTPKEPKINQNSLKAYVNSS